MSKIPMVLNPACIKTLAAVEAHPDRSNQHEFNGVAALEQLFGVARRKIEAVFSVRGEDHSYVAEVTWYDARENHPDRSEHRLYFKRNPVMERAREGDNMLIGFDGDQLNCILIPNASTQYTGWTPSPSLY
ncbi:type II restriction endonuclease [Croceibacterium mercuriale]|uniref:type II restriction endonuclease n=1 Tax=Croceibacterium mercuriale TaxID=1572751 RepID=UPI0009DEC10C|nr:type II restriction endonuclease [Croceibacterium mercuriale]